MSPLFASDCQQSGNFRAASHREAAPVGGRPVPLLARFGPFPGPAGVRRRPGLPGRCPTDQEYRNDEDLIQILLVGCRLTPQGPRLDSES